MSDLTDPTTYVALGRNFWGKSTVDAHDAEHNLVQAGGRLRDGYVVLKFETGVAQFEGVNGIDGTVSFLGAAPEVVTDTREKPPAVRFQVLPRDIKPGDKIDRLDLEINMVKATVREVKKVRLFERTVYKVFLVEYDELPDNRKPWAESGHLRPFILRPTNRVWVEREQ